MAESIPPGTEVGTKKVIVALLIGGTLILIAAGVVLYLRQSGQPTKQVEPTKQTEVAGAPAPLVAPVDRRLLSRHKDAGVNVAMEAKKANQPKTGRRSGAPGPLGTINTKEVERFMNARFGQVKACYERRLKNNPLLEGKLDLQIGISSRGRVTSINVAENTLRDSEMVGCIKRTIRNWKFPKPDGGRVVVAKTFNFKKKK
jgi:outer membrane biosynthesis protein TonB